MACIQDASDVHLSYRPDIFVGESNAVGPYEVRRRLGEGQNCNVFLGVHRTTEEQVALKVLKKKACNDKFATEHMKTEARILLKAPSHKNLIECKHYIESASFKGQYDTPVTVLELCPKGELFDILLNGPACPPSLAKRLMQGIVDGLRHCHRFGIAHRDIKPEQILFNSDWTPKLCDFGFGKEFDPSETFVSTATKCGTSFYMCPEVVSKSHSYDPRAADVWSLGVVLFVCLTGFPPFKSAARGDAHFKLWKCHRARFWTYVSGRGVQLQNEAKELLEHMLEVDMAKRATLHDVQSSLWFKMQPSMEDNAYIAEMEKRWKCAQEHA